jgi:hypothetical protein
MGRREFGHGGRVWGQLVEERTHVPGEDQGMDSGDVVAVVGVGEEGEVIV